MNTKKDNEPLLLKINGKWVNATTWAQSHPGGPETIRRLKGRDATPMFQSLHSEEAWKMVEKMKAVQNETTEMYDRINEQLRESSEESRKAYRVQLAFEKFRQQLTDEGFFTRNWIWDAFYVSSIIFLGALGTWLSYSWPVTASIILGLCMQQAGWIGHDYTHGRGPICDFLGSFVGGIFNGFSRNWWSDKHNTHHCHTNQLGVDSDIQNDPILHLWIPEPSKDVSYRKFQYIYYHIVYAFLYVSWRIQSLSWAWAHRDFKELSLIFLSYLWLSFLPLPVAIGSILIGGWFVAEVVTATHQSEEIYEGIKFDFVVDQFATTRDVLMDSPVGNWFWGGMQFQLVHHLFPIMPKYYYAQVSKKISQWAKENDVEYRTSGPLEILNMNYQTMKKFSQDVPTQKIGQKKTN